MSKKYETGHAKNIGNFEDLLSFCIGFGAAYNPGNAQLQITQLQAKYAACTAELETAVNLKNAYSDITNQRTKAFKELVPFSTKLVSYLVSFGVHKETIKDARVILKKIHGIQPAKADEVPDGTSEPPDSGGKTISRSHRSFDSILFNFIQLVDLVSSQPAYTPTEPEFTVAGLQAKVTQMKGFVTAVSDTNTAIFNARMARNKGLYDAATGLVSIALDVKAYIKAIFGASSSEYKKVAKIPFKYLNAK